MSGAAGVVRGLLEATAPVSGSYNHRHHTRSIDASDLRMAAGREDSLQRSSEATGHTMRVGPYFNLAQGDIIARNTNRRRTQGSLGEIVRRDLHLWPLTWRTTKPAVFLNLVQ